MLALLATAAPLSAAASHKKAPPKCPPAHARVMIADPQAEVYLLPEHFGGPGGVEPTEIFGCAFKGTHRSYLLGEPPESSSSGSGGIDLETLAGPMAAYFAGSGGPGGASWLVEVRNLATGKLVHQVPSGTPAHSKNTMECVPGEPHVAVANAHAVVYEGPSDGNPGEIDACAYGYRRSYPLGPVPYGDATGGSGVFRETLAGTIVAYEFFESHVLNNEGSRKRWVVVRNLRDGRVLHIVPTGIPAKPSEFGNVGTGRTTAIVVKGDGAVAWIAPTGEEIGAFEVHALDRSGSRVLASGLGIDASSLALVGSRLYWMQNGMPASAVLN